MISVSQENTLHRTRLCWLFSRKMLTPSVTSSVRYILDSVLNVLSGEEVELVKVLVIGLNHNAALGTVHVKDGLEHDARAEITSILEDWPVMSSSKAEMVSFCFVDKPVSVTPLAPMVIVFPDGFR